MATTTKQTVGVSQALADLLADVDGLRTYWYVSDTVRAPACVIGQPVLDFTDSTGGFCAAVWDYPLTVVVARASDRDAQTTMSRLLLEIVAALDVEVDGVFSIEAVDARPAPGVVVSGQELPAYLLNIRVRA